MSSITADPQFVNLLSSLNGVTEILDLNGRVVGLFTPKNLAEEQLLYAKAKQCFDPDEMKQRLQDDRDQGSSLDEVWKRIHAREEKRSSQ